MLKIKRMEPSDRATGAAWDAFVTSCPAATFFHRAGWQRVIRDVFRHATHFLYTESDGGITGVLPLAHVRSMLFGNALVSIPFGVYGGVAAHDAESLAALEVAAQDLAKQLRVGHLELRNIEPRHPEWPTQDLYVRFRKDLQPTVDANLLAIPRKQRAMVRKGIGNGLASKTGRDADAFFSLYADNVHRHGTPAFPRRYFKTLLEEFGDDCEVLLVAAPDGTLVSGVLSFYFRNEILPFYAGDTTAARALAANDFKYWELMRRACERGVQVFDYGRSKRDTGSFAFKKNWGFEPQPLYYEYCLYRRDAIPQNNPSAGKYRLLIEAWRRLPIGVANLLGPHIVRNLG
jgi:FemAB-related protein (PEP-CTERM system-associated)